MSEENKNQNGDIEEIEETGAEQEESSPEPAPARRGFFSRRNLGIAAGILSILLVVIVVLVIVFYRNGVFDNYIKAQFVAKMNEIGIVFDADVFRVTVSPLQLELKNATFNDKTTGDKLFFIRDGKIGLTAENLYSWQLSRDFKVDSTDITGAEVWVKFDENGKSNFSNLNLVEDKQGSRVNFKYDSVKFSLKEGLVHFNHIEHKISADARNVSFFLEPTTYAVPDEQKRYNFDITSTDSVFVYDDRPIEPVDIRAKGVADDKGAEISEFKLTTPIGESTMQGRLTDWENLGYDLNINSTVDLTQTSNILPLGTPLRGVANFEGKVTGQGDSYKVEGEIDSQALEAYGIYLKALNVNATVAGTNSMYEGSGKAIAELLTFEDFKIDFPQLIGNIRGTGTDFRWVGELQAAAAKSPLGTLGGLFITDAVADYKDEQFSATLGNIRAGSFADDDILAQSLQAGNVRITSGGGVTNVTAPSVRAKNFKTDDVSMQNVTASNVKVTDRPDRVDVTAGNLQADNAQTEDARLRNLRANNIRVQSRNGVTDIDAADLQAQNVETDDARMRNLRAGNVRVRNRNGVTDIDAGTVRAEQVESGDARLGDLNASGVTVRDTGNETIVFSNNVQVAKLETDAAVLGRLNIAGVRLTIRQGRIEGTSGDIDAGNVALNESDDLPQGGNLQNVKIYKPVFVLEPSGRYRASADMSLGGGTIGSIRLGAATARIVASGDQVALTNLAADVMGGRISGEATIAQNARGRSNINAVFSNLDLGKLLALQGGRVVPIEGQTTGQVNLTFAGKNFKTASGNLTADIVANAGNADKGLIPVTGRVEATATNGLFNLDVARLNTEKSELNATGRLDLNGYDSNLNIALNSSDAAEITRVFRVLEISEEMEQQLDYYQADFAGNLQFTGTLTGNVSEPTIEGRAAVDSFRMRGRELGSLALDVSVSPTATELKNGRLQEPNGGGNLAFNVSIPKGGANNIAVQATLDRINTGNLLAALPLENTQLEQFRDFRASTSGTINLTGLPQNMAGEANLSSTAGTINGQPFDGFEARATFAGALVNLENLNVRFGQGTLRTNGTYNTETTAFNFVVSGKDIDFARVRPFLPGGQPSPAASINGTFDVEATATGLKNDSRTYNVNFSGTGRNVVYDRSGIGVVTFVGRTENQQLNANLTVNFENQPQTITATVNFADENLPFRAETTFNNTELAPFIALVRPPGENDVTVTGRATGTVFLAGNLSRVDDAGKRVFTTENLSGSADFSQLALQIGDTPLTATEAVAIRFNTREVVFERARFTGGGSNIIVSGSKALTEDGINNLTVDGTVNLRILNAISPNTFFSGLTEVDIRLTGPNKTARLNGEAIAQNASIATFVGSERLTFERVRGRVIFTSNQAQIDELTGFLGGGRVSITGGAQLTDNLQLQAFRFGLSGNNITVPLPKDFITTGDAEVEINGRRLNDELTTRISGRINARRSLYTEDIDLADIIGGRSEGSLSQGGSGGPSLFGNVQLDLLLEGRDALVVRNNIADLTASISLRVTGDVAEPQISGRIVANSGTVLFRDARYEVQRGVLEFPPNTTGIQPYINLQAEAEISGYQVSVNLTGNLADTESLNAVVRSNPGLPQGDVVSLITTGSLANNEGGIPTLAQSGINTATEILADEIINKPLSKATDKLFGLNRFEIDPIISGQRLNPTARLTVGRQINRNLLITYSTNLSEDQNQVLALEYRVSNRLSFVAQYEQGSLSNVTRNSNVFSFEVRLRKRF